MGHILRSIQLPIPLPVPLIPHEQNVGYPTGVAGEFNAHFSAMGMWWVGTAQRGKSQPLSAPT